MSSTAQGPVGRPSHIEPVLDGQGGAQKIASVSIELPNASAEKQESSNRRGTTAAQELSEAGSSTFRFQDGSSQGFCARAGIK